MGVPLRMKSRLVIYLAVAMGVVALRQADGNTETINFPGNVTAPVCTDIHLCSYTGCGTHWNQKSACQCDRACSLFDDCCYDYAESCAASTAHAPDDALDGLSGAAFECVALATGSPSTGHYWMVGHCPDNVGSSDVSQDIIRKNCEEPSTDNPYTLIPVIDRQDVTFRNVFCALCNGRPNADSTTVPWTLVNEGCPLSTRLKLQGTSEEADYLRIVWDECSLYFQPPSVDRSGPASRRPCTPSVLADCGSGSPPPSGSVSGDWATHEACRNFTAVVEDESDGQLYRNPACYAACLGEGRPFELTCPTSLDDSFAAVAPVKQSSDGLLFPSDPHTDILHRPVIPAVAFPVEEIDHSINFETIAVVHSLSVSGLGHVSSLDVVVPAMDCLDGEIYVSSTEGCIREPPPLPPLSLIFCFRADECLSEEVACSSGDFYDAFSGECLSPSCAEGFHYVASAYRCLPTVAAAAGSFRCPVWYYRAGGAVSLFLVAEPASFSADEGRNATDAPGGVHPEAGVYNCTRNRLREALAGLAAGVEFFPHMSMPDPGSESNNSTGVVFEVRPQGGNDSNATDADGNDALWSVAKVDRVVELVETRLLRALESVDEETAPCRVERVQLLQNCGGGDPADSLGGRRQDGCRERVWVDFGNETRASPAGNGTLLVRDGDTDSWHSAHNFSLRLSYQHGGIYFNETSAEIGFCNVSTVQACPSRVLDENRFSEMDESTGEPDGSVRVKDTGQVLGPDDYVRTDDGKIRVCLSLLTTNDSLVEGHPLSFDRSQAILSAVGLSVSVLTGSLTVLTYAVFSGLHARTRRAIVGMATSLILAQVLFLLSGVASADEGVCLAVAIADHYLWMASISWTNVLAFILYKTLCTKALDPSRGRVAFGSKTNLLSLAYAFGVPLAVLVPCLAVHFCDCTGAGSLYAQDGICWLRAGQPNLLAFGVPVAAFLVVNIVLFARVAVAIRSSYRKSEANFKSRDRSTLRRRRKELAIYARLASLMGFTWIFGFLYNAIPEVDALLYLFILLNSLQGLFIFLSFTCTAQVAELWRKKLSTGRFHLRTRSGPLTSRRSKPSATSNTASTSVSAGVAASEAMEMSAASASGGGGGDGDTNKSPTASHSRAGRLRDLVLRFLVRDASPAPTDAEKQPGRGGEPAGLAPPPGEPPAGEFIEESGSSDAGVDRDSSPSWPPSPSASGAGQSGPTTIRPDRAAAGETGRGRRGSAGAGARGRKPMPLPLQKPGEVHFNETQPPSGRGTTTVPSYPSSSPPLGDALPPGEARLGSSEVHGQPGFAKPPLPPKNFKIGGKIGRKPLPSSKPSQVEHGVA